MKYFIKIFSFAKPYKLRIFFSLICSLLFVILNNASLWMIGTLLSTILNPNKINNTNNIINQNSAILQLDKITQQLLGSGDSIEQLKILCITMLVIFLLKNIFFYLSNVNMHYVNNRMIMDIRNKIFTHIQKLPMSFFHNNKVGEISYIAVSDAARMRTAVSIVLNKLTKEPLNILMMGTILILINPKLTLISLIIIPLVGIVVMKIGQSIRRKTLRSSKQIAGVMSILQENISGIEVVKSFVQENSEMRKFKNETLKYFKLMFRENKLTSITSPMNDMIGVSIAVILLWVGGNEVFKYNTLDPDNFIKFIVFLFSVLRPIKSLAGVNLSIQTSIASAERVFSIIDVNPQIENEKTKNILDFNEKIKFENVKFSYSDGDKPVLGNINFSIPKGKKYAIVGESGSGKSTLVNLLPRFYDIDSGDILIDDNSIYDISMNSLRKMIGIVSQDTFLFNNSIKNNICYGDNDENYSMEEIINATKLANAHDFIINTEFGYDTIIGERGIKLSGGQKQRLSIARAILKNPPILIFDEATSSLDTKSEKIIQEAIDNLLADRTVIIIAHRLSTIINADKILLLDKGEIIEEGNHQKLLSMDGKYKDLHSTYLEKK